MEISDSVFMTRVSVEGCFFFAEFLGLKRLTYTWLNMVCASIIIIMNIRSLLSLTKLGQVCRISAKERFKPE